MSRSPAIGKPARGPASSLPTTWSPEAVAALLTATLAPEGCVFRFDDRPIDGPPYVHTFRPPEGVWQDCSACEGTGGAMVDGEWADCDTCQGEEGWMVYPDQPPSLTIEGAG